MFVRFLRSGLEDDTALEHSDYSLVLRTSSEDRLVLAGTRCSCSQEQMENPSSSYRMGKDLSLSRAMIVIPTLGGSRYQMSGATPRKVLAENFAITAYRFRIDTFPASAYLRTRFEDLGVTKFIGVMQPQDITHLSCSNLRQCLSMISRMLNI